MVCDMAVSIIPRRATSTVDAGVSVLAGAGALAGTRPRRVLARSFLAGGGFCRGARRRALGRRARHGCGRRSRGGGLGGGRGLGGRRRRLASPASAPRRRGLEQCLALLERERLRVAVLRDAAVALAVGDVRAIAAVQHLNAGLGELADDALGLDLELFADQLAGALGGDRV